MNNKLKITITTAFLGILAAVVFTAFFPVKPASASLLQDTNPTFYLASSTAYVLTTTSQRILATSSPQYRLATLIQPINCTTGSNVFLSFNKDVAAAVNTGIIVLASTTQQFGSFPNLPIVQGSVQAVTSAGTCTLLVSEWRQIQ